MNDMTAEKEPLDLDEETLERARRVFALLGDPTSDDSDSW